MYNNPEILSFNSSHLMLRILSQDNLDHRGGFLKPLNKTHILQNKYLQSEQIIPLWTIPTPDPHLGPGIVRGQVSITRCSIPSGPEVSSQDICWHSDTLHFLLLPHAALSVSLCLGIFWWDTSNRDGCGELLLGEVKGVLQTH